MYKTASEIADSVLTKMAEGEEESLGQNAAMLGYAGGSVGGLGLMAGGQDVGRSLLNQARQGEQLYSREMLNRMKPFAEAAGMHLNTVPDAALSSYAPKPTAISRALEEVQPVVKYLANRQQINLAEKTNPFIAAHEVGHASGGKIRQALMRSKAPLMVGGALGSMGLLGHAALTGEKGEGMGATGYAAPAVAAVAPALNQAEELMATLKARKLLAQSGMKVKGLGKLMGKQQLGYLLGHLGAVAPAAGGALALHHYLKPKEEAEDV